MPSMPSALCISLLIYPHIQALLVPTASPSWFKVDITVDKIAVKSLDLPLLFLAFAACIRPVG